jgi:pyruvate,water dikinase
MMTRPTAAHEELCWEPPSKGDWRGLHDHFPRALTAEYERLLADGMVHGEAVWIERYGLPVRTISPAFVHGRVFISAEPLVGPRSDRVPPAWLMRAVVAVAPAFRRRARAAARAVAERPWLAEARHWFEVEEPRWTAGNQARQGIDPGELDDAALAAHLQDLEAWAKEGYRTHFRLHGCDLIPTGRLLTAAAGWGLDPVEVAGLLAGWSPTSRGDEALPDWCLVTGYDLDSLSVAELPDRTARPDPATSRPLVDDDHVRDQVPPEERARWDELLADARATYGVRDSNGLLTAAWPVGLLRRAYLEAGRRLHERGALHERDHVLELTVDELTAQLEHPRIPPEAPAARAERRRALSAHAAPPALGPPQDLPLAALPAAMRDLATALLGLRDLGITSSDVARPLEGVGIGRERVVGRACVAHDAAEAIARFEPGDIMVTAGTCPAWNSVLALSSGVVTEEGGPLSHAAVIARELGLPAVIGCFEARSHIPDGAMIELDPGSGTVRIVDQGALQSF